MSGDTDDTPDAPTAARAASGRPASPRGVIGKDGEVPTFGTRHPPRRDRPRGAGPDPMAQNPEREPADDPGTG